MTRPTLKFSIRKFLFINLFLTLTLTTTLLGIANYLLDQKYDLYILLFIFPLSALLIWLIVSKGLDSLLRLEHALSHRALGHLEPVKLSTVPQEIKPLVNEINQLFERLRAGIAREKRFVADAAHELRTPLAALKAQAQVALNEKSLEEKNHALQKLMVTLDRSIHMIQQLLLMSQIGPETYGAKEMARINLIDVVQEVMALLVPKADSKKIDLSFEYSENVLQIKANATAISILVRNLLENAIQYSKTGGIVQVRALRQGKGCILEVSDNGPGIPKALRRRVFERFYRVVGSQPPGSGLGLAIVHQICQLHHAKIELDAPKEGTGLLVRVYF